jgi:uncharacterized membrane protein YdjX (TVP38/TMEM64 family)
MIAASMLPALPWWDFIVFMLGGIVVGAFIDAAAGPQDRTLIGIEIGLLWIVLIGPIAIGVVLGRSLKTRGGAMHT